MAKHILVVVTNPAPGKDKEYNDWYTNQHLDDVLRVKGFVAAQRFKVNLEAAKNLAGPYLAIYEMETDDPQAAMADLAKATESGQMPISSALDTVNIVSSVCSPITERKVRIREAGSM